MMIAAVTVPHPGLGERLRGVHVDQAGELGQQFPFFAADLSDPLQQPFSDPQLRGLRLAGELTSQPGTIRGPFSDAPSCASRSGAIATRCQRSRQIIRVRSQMI
jgi:hypothetical protein